MKRNLTLMIIAILMPVLAFGNTEWISLQNGSSKNQVKLISSNNTEIIIKVKVNAYAFREVNTPQGLASVVLTPDGTQLLETGAPDLPKFTNSVIIPGNQNMGIEILASSYNEFQNIDVAPSKGNFTRDIDPSTVPYTYGKAYGKNSFWPGTVASLRNPYILRNFRGQTIVFTPFHYNPTTKVLRIYTDFTVRLYPEEGKVVNPLISSGSVNKNVAEFEHIYKKQFLNFNPAKYTAVGEEGEMLIICHPDFIEAMEPFVAWKIQRGMETTIENSTNYANAAAIKTYIQSFYTSNNLCYVLIVGDANYVPTISSSSGDSDNSFGYLSGNDSYSEVFVGRFSCETVAHCQTMVERSVEYELSPQASGFYGRSLGLASSQGPGDDNEYDYQHVRNMQTDLNAFTYTAGTEFFDGSQGGLDAAGNPLSSAVGSELNGNGAGVILYTGHGSNISFSTSGFSNTNVNALTNSNKLPFIWAVACVNGNFVNNTCFAEAWTRATYNGEPTGAIATLMSTINQSWDPPMCGQDEMVDILTESYANNILRSFGAISMNGIMQMNDEYGASGSSMANTWNLFGDPSVMVRTATPQTVTVSHLPTTFIGSNQFTVNCGLNDATVALTMGSNILGTAKVINGIALVNHPALTNVGIITVTVTGFNMDTYVGSVEIIPNNGPYVTFSSVLVQDPTGNNNNLPDFSEDVTLDISLTNVGIELASNVNGVLSTSDTAVTITNSTYAFGNIDSSAMVQATNTYALTIVDFVDDQHVVNLDLTLVDDSANNWGSTFNIILNAPNLELEYIDLTEQGAIQNNRLDPGENVILNLQGINTGHAQSPDANCTISSTSPYVTINNSTINIGAMDINNSMPLSVNVDISATTPIGTMVDFTFELTAGLYTTSLSIEKKVGLIVEDWEANTFTNFNWVNDNVFPWTITGTSPFEGSFMAKSGTIGDNQNSELILTIETTADDSLSFYKKVSCEAPGWTIYDYLEFFIDNVSQDQWGGEIDWSKEQYWLTAGTHTLKWVYAKDNMVSGGSDCAWIDFIVLPPLDMNYQPLFITNTDTIAVEYGSLFSLTIEAFDMNSTDILYMGGSIVPTWITLTDNGNWTCDLTGNPDFALVGFHDVEIWLTDALSDTVYMPFVIKVYNPVGAEDISNDVSFGVSPNPACNILYLTAQLSDAQKADVRIYDILGEMITMPYVDYQFKAGKNKLSVPVNELNSGIYFIEVSGEKLKWQRKVVITK
ncbi:MAG: C25 family cysteine peptidase [Bacteroidota bacterium]|nr:C25 family cysteine peptidase [Bacteroidota bacterium]